MTFEVGFQDRESDHHNVAFCHWVQATSRRLDGARSVLVSLSQIASVVWLADSRSRVKLFPAGVQDDIGYALYVVQLGERGVKAKALHGFGGQVRELAAYDASGTYRAIYTASIGESIYLIHTFQKKSKVGIATPKPEMDLIRQRLKQLRGEVKSAEKRGS